MSPAACSARRWCAADLPQTETYIVTETEAYPWTA